MCAESALTLQRVVMNAQLSEIIENVIENLLLFTEDSSESDAEYH